MCVALPGIVKSIDGSMAKVCFDGNIVNAHTGIAKVNTGDYVLVHAGMIIQKLDKEEADNMISLFKELEEITGESND